MNYLVATAVGTAVILLLITALTWLNTLGNEEQLTQYMHDALVSAFYQRTERDGMKLGTIRVGYCPLKTTKGPRHSWFVISYGETQLGSSIDVEKSLVPNLDIETFTGKLQDSMTKLSQGDYSEVKYKTDDECQAASQWFIGAF